MTDREHNNAILNEFNGWKRTRDCSGGNYLCDCMSPVEWLDYYARENFDRLEALADKFATDMRAEVVTFRMWDAGALWYCAAAGDDASERARWGDPNRAGDKQTALADALAAALKEQK